MRDGLVKQYQETYLRDVFNEQKLKGQINIKFNHFNEQQIESIIRQPWKGSDFSTRIWNNYTKVLPEYLTDAMLRGTLMGYSYNRIATMMRERMHNFSDSNLHRLVITEMGHATEEATAQFYKDSDIEQYQYLATLESHTCDQCAHLDERIFNVKDRVVGLNYPLIHPYCRCTTVPYMKDLPDVETRWTRNESTGKGEWVRNMTFAEWKRKVQEQANNSIKLEAPNKYAKSIPIVLTKRSLPTKGKPLSVVGKKMNGKIVQYRYYDEEGYVEKDLDLTDHGNPKEHPVVPHLHTWTRVWNEKRGKMIPRRHHWKKPGRNEIKDLRRWKHDQDES